MYLFHATVDSNKENILKNGLRLANKNSIMYDGSKTKGKIFLANDYDIAYSFVESSDTDDEKNDAAMPPAPPLASVFPAAADCLMSCSPAAENGGPHPCH